MELKLDIYNKREIVKTYTAETYELLFGTVEDLIDLVNLDKLKTGSDEELIQIVGEAIGKGLGIIKPLLKDIFDGLTDDELRNTKTTDIAKVLVEVIKYSINEITKGATRKN